MFNACFLLHDGCQRSVAIPMLVVASASRLISAVRVDARIDCLSRRSCRKSFVLLAEHRIGSSLLPTFWLDFVFTVF
jgi:hypothetical protein